MAPPPASGPSSPRPPASHLSGASVPSFELREPAAVTSGREPRRSPPGTGLPARGLGVGDTLCGEKVQALGCGGRWAAGREAGRPVRRGAAERAPTRRPLWAPTRRRAAAGVVLVQVTLQRVPAAAHTHHHVAPQHLWGPARAGHCLSPGPSGSSPVPLPAGQPHTLTRTKMSRLESPTRYFPSETLIMGNWSGQVQWPKISLT